MTVKGIKEAGRIEIQPQLLCCRGCCSDDWISCVSHVLLLTDTTGDALQLPLSHVFFTHCVFTVRFLSEHSGGNFACADLLIMTV